ncbi:hypothetical protein Godav_014974 [Gossypium davidsonii]|uniref:Reverse transcriptase zinc-binding domain-containing protein n=1 Tax=Gossypium davidsonii TaxID=34287 RepID=A0A7J8RLH9_GOSDV|nr:hypothetical protein [Gossypium davidsonii]
MGEQICELPIIPNRPTDRVIWFHNKHGSYTMKSTYSWLIFKKAGFGPHRLFWKIIWKLQILPKILFMWRLSHDFLLKNVQISSIKQSFGKGCLKCSDDGDETAFHALKECTKACAILALRGLNGSLLKRFTKDALIVIIFVSIARQAPSTSTIGQPRMGHTKSISSVVEKHGWQAFCLLPDDVFPQMLKEIYAHLSSPENALSMCEVKVPLQVNKEQTPNKGVISKKLLLEPEKEDDEGEKPTAKKYTTEK